MFKQKKDSTATTAPADAVEQARARARQRLIGAIVLLAIGIIGFPLVFETQPRPIPVDIPIEIPRKDAVPPLEAAPAPADAQRSGSSATPGSESDGVITESRSDAGRDVPSPSQAILAKPRESAPAQTASAPHPATVSVLSAAEQASTSTATHRAAAATAQASRAAGQRAETSREDKEKARTEASRADAARARALLEGHSVAAASASRYVVQVGAFADAQAAREVRQKVEKLGLKTYTQVAQTSAGSRIRVRVGPFASRVEADAALAKARAAGLAAVVVTL